MLEMVKLATTLIVAIAQEELASCFSHFVGLLAQLSLLGGYVCTV